MLRLFHKWFCTIVVWEIDDRLRFSAAINRDRALCSPVIHADGFGPWKHPTGGGVVSARVAILSHYFPLTTLSRKIFFYILDIQKHLFI